MEPRVFDLAKQRIDQCHDGCTRQDIGEQTQ